MMTWIWIIIWKHEILNYIDEDPLIHYACKGNVIRKEMSPCKSVWPIQSTISFETKSASNKQTNYKMKVLSIQILYKGNAIAAQHDLDSFSYFQRGSIQEFMVNYYIHSIHSIYSIRLIHLNLIHSIYLINLNLTLSIPFIYWNSIRCIFSSLHDFFQSNSFIDSLLSHINYYQ